ncbi:acetamidase [Acrodontium crateriforme]|uniref:amidase n=1 Tax=Acrodontium crateriforme TaxID=150365 RepID=A0AAQ3M0A2_9PEZI|nr:acetamidase [Acrodontium crateriforme]
MSTANQDDWTSIAAKAQTRLINSIPSDWRIPPSKLPKDDELNVTGFPAKCGILNDFELEITESLATDIVGRLAAGEWTAVEVTTAFCKRAAIAHQVTRCLTITMFDDAMKRAKQLDEHFSKTGQTVGPLHGLPISLKDNFNIIGKPSSVGFCSWALDPMQEESSLVGMLRDLGAVLYTKTNVPTAMMIAESVNNCYGRTVNPLNRALTSGGSSGGESALIAMCGSPLGVGTDIGGSLRIPAACTAIFTIRPSFGRFPHFDARSGLAGQESVASVQGPMARSIADLRLWSESIIGAEPWLRDPKCLEIPWRQVQLKPKLKIAVLWDNGIVTPTPPVKRALKTVVEKLKAKGYDIVDWKPDFHQEILDIMAKLFLADGGKSVRKILEPVDEPFRPEMEPYANSPEMTVYELWQVQKARTALCKKYLDRWQACEGLDAILGPTTPYTAPKNGEFKHVGYTGVFNVLDYSAVSFPTGIHADKMVDISPSDFKPYSEMDAVTNKDYDAVAVHGMPVSLQLTGRKLQEEKILAITERVLADLA